MNELTGADRQLIDTAVELLRRRARQGRSVVASALRTADGDVFTGLHIAANVARVSICAEAVALSAAITAEATRFDTIATVHYALSDEDRFGWALVSPCGMCRELLSDYAPRLAVLIPADGRDPNAVAIESFLPAKFQRP